MCTHTPLNVHISACIHTHMHCVGGWYATRTAVARNALEVALRKGKGNLLALQQTETVQLSSNGFAEDQSPFVEVLGFTDFSTQ